MNFRLVKPFFSRFLSPAQKSNPWASQEIRPNLQNRRFFGLVMSKNRSRPKKLDFFVNEYDHNLTWLAFDSFLWPSNVKFFRKFCENWIQNSIWVKLRVSLFFQLFRKKPKSNSKYIKPQFVQTLKFLVQNFFENWLVFGSFFEGDQPDEMNSINFWLILWILLSFLA